MTMQYNALLVTDHQKEQRKSKAMSSFSKKQSQTPWLCMELWFHSSEEDMPQIGLEISAVVSYYGRN